MTQPERSYSVGVGYTLATGRLFAPMAEFHVFAEVLLGRPILTHEFGEDDLWTELREAFEAQTRANYIKDGWTVGATHDA